MLTGIDVAAPFSPDANTTDGTADIRGADGAHVTHVESNNNGTGVDIGLGTSIVFGQYGTLTLQQNGDYNYHRTSGSGWRWGRRLHLHDHGRG